MFNLDDLVMASARSLTAELLFSLSMLCSLEARGSPSPAYTQVEGGAEGFKGSTRKNWINGCHCGIHVSSTDRSWQWKLGYLRGPIAFHLTLQLIFMAICAGECPATLGFRDCERDKPLGSSSKREDFAVSPSGPQVQPCYSSLLPSHTHTHGPSEAPVFNHWPPWAGWAESVSSGGLVKVRWLVWRAVHKWKEGVKRRWWGRK